MYLGNFERFKRWFNKMFGWNKKYIFKFIKLIFQEKINSN